LKTIVFFLKINYLHPQIMDVEVDSSCTLDAADGASSKGKIA
jgi:hypothetical protein